MRALVKRLTNAALRPLGVQLVAAADDERQALVDLLHGRSIGHVLDIGANKGQFARQLLEKGYRGKIHCCEPLSEAHAALSAAFGGHAQVEVLPRCAVGERSGEIAINIAGNSVSSSVKPMLASHSDAAPLSVYEGSEKVPLTTLDDLLAVRADILAEGLLIKIDTQGNEAEVLAGGQDSLAKSSGVLLEMSVSELYEGQALWDKLHSTLVDAGFALWNLMPDFRDPRTGRLLQFDGLYLRD